MFAALTLEREPLTLTWNTFPGYLNTWAQVVGGFAMLGLVIWLIFYLVSRGSLETINLLARSGVGTLVVLLCVLFGPLGALAVYLLAGRRKGGFADDGTGTGRSPLALLLFIGAFVWAGFGYLLLLALYLPDILRSGPAEAAATDAAGRAVDWRHVMQGVLWTLAGASALLAVLVPIAADFLGRPRRHRLMSAIGRGLHRTVRRPTLWVLLALLLVFFLGVRFVPTRDWPFWKASTLGLLLRVGAAVWIGLFYQTLSGQPLKPLFTRLSWGKSTLLFIGVCCVVFAPGDWVRSQVGAITAGVAIGAFGLTWLVESYRELGDFLGLHRVYALAQLSIKEAVRRKVLWVFLALLLVVLFGSWFIQNKPEDQVRTYVQVISLATALLMLIVAALMSSFGIPDDIRHQTIHTVLTKPVQRFEIFMGRFLGYSALMTAALVVTTGLGLLYLLRNINPEAQEESLKAREPSYGTLTFQGTKDKEKGESVGREWEYRTYINARPRGSTNPIQYAVWSFPEVPGALKDRDNARLEFALDIYRTHKGEREGEGVLGTILVESWRFDADRPEMMKLYESRKEELRAQGVRDVEAQLAEELGFFQFGPMEIKDYHTQAVEVPKGVFVNAARPATAEDRERPGLSRRGGDGPPPPLRVRVRCDSPGQFLGMAKRDLYFRLDNDDSPAANKARFAVNFFKGSFGLWLRLCLMIGLAVAVSTYLSGVISLLTTAILYVLGFFRDFITDVATGKNLGGGPLEGTMRLLKRPGGEPTAGQLDDTATTQVATGIDEVFRWGLRRALSVIPEVSRYSFTDFVAEGMSIPPGDLAMALLLLLGYLLPWAVLAYYLLKWREVASST
jgi:ABC-type transport system involved in multi-copper enzyme maturation permease subunit